jgi:hypothetical protein
MVRKSGVGSNQYQTRAGHTDLAVAGSGPDLMTQTAATHRLAAADLEHLGPDRWSVPMSEVPPGELCFVYQHFDSRGGTVGIWAANRQQADQIYLDEFFGGDVYAKNVVEEDYAGPVWFQHPDMSPADLWQSDLDDPDVGVVMVANQPELLGELETPEGQVQIVRFFSARQLDELPDEEDTHTDESGCVWGHPGWNDDAFGFVVRGHGVSQA